MRYVDASPGFGFRFEFHALCLLSGTVRYAPGSVEKLLLLWLADEMKITKNYPQV